MQIDFLKLISSKGYLTISKELARNIGLDETLVLTELISKYNYWNEKQQLDEEDYFYLTVEDLEYETTLSKYKQTQAINNLKKLKLIQTIVKGLPAKRYFKINENNIKKLFFFDSKKSEECRNDKEVKNLTSSSKIFNQQEVKNSTQLRTNNNIKIEEEESINFQNKFEKIFGKKLTVDLYNKILKLYSNKKIINYALELAELNADQPAYILKVFNDWKKNKLINIDEIKKYVENRKSVKDKTEKLKNSSQEVQDCYKHLWND